MPKEIESLVNGYREFRNSYFNRHKEMFEYLACYGQAPKILVIACSDSRVDPAIITNGQPGDLFVIRNVANLVPTYQESNIQDYHGTSAALEFGICVLNIRHIVVLGHSECGGIEALVQGQSEIQKNYFVNRWMDLARPARDMVLKKHVNSSICDQVNLCSQYSIMNSINNLISFPWIAKRVENGEVFLHPWYFDLSSGTLCEYNKESQLFEDLF